MASINPKNFEIVLHQAQNEPFLTLQQLQALIGSISSAFNIGHDTIHNPNPALFKIIAENRTVFTKQDIKFDIAAVKQKDQTNPTRGNNYVNNILYPEDVIEIFEQSRQWLSAKYTELKQHSWSPETSQLKTLLGDAIDRQLNESGLTNQFIADFSRKHLKDATTELLTEIKKLVEKKTDSLKYDSIDELIEKIKKEFVTAPHKTWEEVGLELTKALTTAKPGAPNVTTPDKNYLISDVRLFINTIYKEIVTQLEKKEGPEKPWDRASKDSKKVFNSQEAPFFKGNILPKTDISDKDTTEASKFINQITQLLTELEKEPPVAETITDDGDEADQNEGGGEDEPLEEKGQSKSLEDISKEAINALTYHSEATFFDFLRNTSHDPNNLEEIQKDWLLIKLQETIVNLLTPENKKQLKVEISTWIATQHIPYDEEGDLYHISNDQLQILNSFLAKQFFTTHLRIFSDLITSVPTTAELKQKSKPVKADALEKTAVVPDVDTSTAAAVAETAVGLDVKRGKEIAVLANEFIALKFGEDIQSLFGKDTKFFRELVYDQIAAGYDPNQSKFDLFARLQLNQKIFETAQQRYTQKLAALGIDNNFSLGKLYTALDALITVHQQPQTYIKKLNDAELLAYFGLEDDGVNVSELRSLVVGLLSISLYRQRNNIHPWHTTDSDDQQITKDLVGVRKFIQAHGTDGAAALNNDLEGIGKLSLNEKRKQEIRELYRAVWIKTIADRPQEEIIALLIFYGVDNLEIDPAKPHEIDVPEGFIFSQMNQVANNTFNPNTTPTKQSALISKGKAALAKAGLKLVAPEVALALDVLEKIPILGDVAQDIEEKTGNLVLITLGAGAATLAALLKGGASALAGAVGGGLIGFALGGPGGAAVGAGLGGWLGGGGAKSIGNWFKGFGVSGGGGGLGGGPILQAGAGGIGNGALATASTTFKIASGTIVGGTVIATITAGGTQLHPTSGFNTTDPGTGEASPYVKITKEANPKYLDEPGRITYTVNITPKDGYNITVTDVLDELKIRYNKDKYPSGVPTPDTEPKTIDDFPDLEVGTTINFGETLTLTYKVDYDSDFQHANVANYFTFSFDYSNGAESGSAEAMSLASVKFGEPPIFDGGWPVCSGSITQLPFGSYSHLSKTSGYGADAIDIGSVGIGTTVYATFGGEVTVAGTRGEYGTAIVIDSDDGFFIYAHLSKMFVSVGSTVSAGDEIGLTGDTGAGAAHLHYERSNTSGFYTTPVSAGSTLLQLHESIDLEEGDTISRVDDRCGD